MFLEQTLNKIKEKIKETNYSKNADTLLDLCELLNTRPLGLVIGREELKAGSVTYLKNGVAKCTKLSTFLRNLKSMSVEPFINPESKTIVTFCEIYGNISKEYSEVKFKLYQGADIGFQYNELGIDSCLVKNPGITLYEKNPERVQLLVTESADRKARALLWKADDGTFFLDRIYPNDSPLISKMIEYANKKGWIARRHQNASANASNTRMISDRGKEIYLQTTLKAIDNANPYLDSFYFGYLRDDKLTLSTAPDLEIVNYVGASPDNKKRQIPYCEATEHDHYSGRIATVTSWNPEVKRRWCNNCSANINKRKTTAPEIDFFTKKTFDAARQTARLKFTLSEADEFVLPISNETLKKIKEDKDSFIDEIEASLGDTILLFELFEEKES